MEKILIIGSGGAGKSTLSRQLGNILNLEVIHLDRWVWNYPRDRRPAILEKFGQLATDKKVIILRSPSSVKQFLHNISRSEVPTDLQCAKTPNF